MEKLSKTIVKDISMLTLFSSFIVAFSWLLYFVWSDCSPLPSLFSGTGALAGIISLILAVRRQEKGKWLAILSIIFGIAGLVILVNFC